MAARCRGACSAKLAGKPDCQGSFRRFGAAGANETGAARRKLRGFRRSGGVRFVSVIVLLVLAGLIGLFVYGQMMEPEIREIEVDASHAAQ